MLKGVFLIKLNFIIIEDNEADYLLCVRHLRQQFGDIRSRQVLTETDFRAALNDPGIDLVLSDYNVPGFGAERALSILKELHRDIPFIVVSGAIGEENAVEMIKAGAVDFISKDKMERLSATVKKSLGEHEQRRLIKDRVQQAQQAATQQEESLAIVSHDIKNPLNSIQLLCELTRDKLASDSPDKEKQINDNLHKIEKSVFRIKMLVSDYLDREKIQAGTFQVEKTLSRVDLLCEEVRDLFTPIADDKGIQLEIDCVKPDVYAPFDYRRLMQAMMNVVGNAFKFTPPGGTVRVSIESNADALKIYVQDTGHGIAKEHLPHIFQKYWQAEMKGGGPSVGLGLYISKGILIAHGGDVEVKSQPGSGTTFTFTLPKDQSGGFRMKRPSTQNRQQTIMLIEDDEDLRDVVEDLLTAEGFHVASSNNGRQGYEALRDGQVLPHLVLVDYQLPEMSGDEIVRRLLSEKDFPVLLMSAQNDIDKQVEPHDRLLLLKKPYAFMELIQKINSALGL